MYKVAVAGRSGRGNYGHQLDTVWRKIPQTTIVGVSDDNPKGLKAAVERLKVRQGFADFREMLDKTKPDIMAICPRWVDQHHAMAMAAIERGIHVYVEKPFVRTLEEADEIVAACKRQKVKLAIAHPTRYSPKLQTVAKLIKGGAIGRVLEYRMRGKEDGRGGGEDLWVLGAHVIDMVRALAGTPSWCFARVTENGKPITKADVEEGREGIGPLAGDAIHALYGYEDDVIATFDSIRGAGQRPSRYGVQICGSEGIIELLEHSMPSVKYLGDPAWSPGRSGVGWKDVSSAGIDKPEPLDHPKYRDRHWVAIESLLKAIETDGIAPCNEVEGRGIVEMIAAVFESQRVGTAVSFPLKTRKNPLRLF